MRAVHACVLLAVCAAALLALNVAGSGSAIELENVGIQQTVAHEMRKRESYELQRAHEHLSTAARLMKKLSRIGAAHAGSAASSLAVATEKVTKMETVGVMGVPGRATGLAASGSALSSSPKNGDHHKKSAPPKEAPFRRRGCTPHCARKHAHDVKEQPQGHVSKIQSRKVDHARRHAAHRHHTRKVEKNLHEHLHLNHGHAGVVSKAITRSVSKTSRAVAALKKAKRAHADDKFVHMGGVSHLGAPAGPKLLGRDRKVQLHRLRMTARGNDVGGADRLREIPGGVPVA